MKFANVGEKILTLFFWLPTNPIQERQIIPLLRFYYTNDISIYVTSAIYSPSVIIDHDLDGVIFDDMP